MFDNIGGKIKGLATVVTWIGIISSCIAGLSLFIVGLSAASYSGEAAIIGFFSGLIVAGLGSLISWISSLQLYGFGQIVENTDILVRNTDMIARGSSVPTMSSPTVPPYSSSGTYTGGTYDGGTYGGTSGTYGTASKPGLKGSLYNN